MERYQGHRVVSGIAAGPIYVLKEKTEYKELNLCQDQEEECQLVHRAIAKTMRQLEILTEQARIYAGESAADIFEAHQMILMDEEFADYIYEQIRENGCSGQAAVQQTGSHFSEMFSAMDMEYMRARASDIRDITDRILQNMNEEEEERIRQIRQNGPVILFAESVNPSDILRLGRETVLGLVTTKGSVTSHAAILARSMNVPTLIHVASLPLEGMKNGTYAIVDAEHSCVILNPSEEEILQAKEQHNIQKEEEKALLSMIGVKSITSAGREVKVNAYITDMEEIDKILEIGGDGIGLYRSEFLFMGRKDFPTEEEQFRSYRTLVQRMQGKPVVIRTMDIGSDKPLDYFKLEYEENPALGCRGIRVSLKYPELFKVQLRALFRAAVYGDLSIMYPLITSTVELDNIQKIIGEAVLDLEREKLSYRIPPQGIMIETPAAVMIADELAERVHFFSIGTNDLAQYALGIDRENTDLNLMHNPQHEGIIRMIGMAIEAGHRHNIRVGVCGEMASDTTLLKRFVRMGADDVSVSVGRILKTKKIITEV